MAVLIQQMEMKVIIQGLVNIQKVGVNSNCNGQLWTHLGHLRGYFCHPQSQIQKKHKKLVHKGISLWSQLFLHWFFLGWAGWITFMRTSKQFWHKLLGPYTGIQISPKQTKTMTLNQFPFSHHTHNWHLHPSFKGHSFSGQGLWVCTPDPQELYMCIYNQESRTHWNHLLLQLQQHNLHASPGQAALPASDTQVTRYHNIDTVFDGMPKATLYSS